MNIIYYRDNDTFTKVARVYGYAPIGETIEIMREYNWLDQKVDDLGITRNIHAGDIIINKFMGGGFMVTDGDYEPIDEVTYWRFVDL